MAKITYDENGNEVDYLAERNEEIKESLRDAFQILLEERDGDRNGKKRLGNRMQMQINMLYDIFMTSALPQYQKDAVGERISAMNKLLTARSNEESSDSSISEIGG